MTDSTNSKFDELLKTDGFFSFSEDGFTIEGIKGLYRWDRIQSIIGFKRDLYTVDQICLGVLFEDGSLEFNEDHSGWYQFEKQLRNHFPSINKDWSEKVMLPAFETNLTLLYDAHGRTINEIEKLYFTDSEKKWWEFWK